MGPLVLLVLPGLAGCRWDGPSSGVEVVPPATVALPPPAAGPGGEMALEAPLGHDAEPSSASAAVTEPGALSPVTPTTVRRQTPARLPRTVAVVGDSLTLSASEEIEAVLSGMGIDVLVVDAAESRRLARGSVPPSGIDAIEQIAAVASPELWVIALGTNDVGAASSPDQFRADLTTVLAGVPTGSPVVWVDFWIRDRLPAIDAANDELRTVLRHRPATVVADWFAHGDDTGVVTHDGVHLTAAGQQVFASTIADAVTTLFD